MNVAPIKRHIRNCYAYYLIWTLVSLVSVAVGFTYRSKTPEDKKIDILISTTTIDKYFDDYLSSIKPSYLYELNYRYIMDGDSNFNSILSTYGSVEADIFILSKTTMDTLNLASLFLPLTSSSCQKEFGDSLSYYSQGDDDKDYAFKVSSEHFGGYDDYYLGFATSSIHLGSLNGSLYDGDLQVARSFLS